MKLSNCYVPRFQPSIRIILSISLAGATTAAASTWTGAVNSNWFEAGNWNFASVPSAGNSAIINQGTPIITGGQSSSINDFYVNTESSVLTIAGFNTAGNRSTLTANVGTISGELKILDGGLLKSYNLDARNSATISGVNSNGISSTIVSVGSLSVSAGEFIVLDGASVTNRLGTIYGNLIVSGVADGGERSSWRTTQMFEVGLNGTIDILGGGLFVSETFYLSYNTAPRSHTQATVSGVSAAGIPSTLSVIGLSLGGGNGRADMVISDGGLAEARRGSIELERGSSIHVAGVNADGKRSTLLSAGVLNVWTGSLLVSGGGLAECPSVSMGFRGKNSSVTVTGTDGNGNASTLWCKTGGIQTSFPPNARIVVADGGHLIASFVGLDNGVGQGGLHELQLNGGQQQGILETAYVSAFQADARITFDGGVFRSTAAGELLRKLDPGEVRFLEGGAYFDTQDHSNQIDVALEGVGGLTKLGSGTLTLTGANSYEGNTTVQEGLLVLKNTTGSATGSGDVRVLRQGSLGGNGIVSGNLVNHGLVSPGDPYDTLTGNSHGVSGATLLVEGDYTQMKKSALRIVSFSPTDMGRLLVKGNVSLHGHLVFIPLQDSLEFGQSYRLLESTGTITGKFDNVRLFNSNSFRNAIETNEHSVDLIVAPQSYTEVATSTNEISLASALDTWIDSHSGDTKSVVNALDQLSAAEYHSAFAAISPSLYEAARTIGVEQSQNQLRLLGQHLGSRQLLPDVATDKRWDAWAVGSGQYSSGSMTPVDGESLTSGGFLTGADRKVAPGTTAGIFAGYNHSQGNFPGTNEIKQDSLVLGGYATYQRDGFYANSVIGSGTLDSDVTRDIRFGTLSRTARSNTDGSEFFSSISGGYDFHHANWTFGPTGSLQYSRVSYGSLDETGAGALNLHVDGTSGDSFRSLIGGRTAYLLKVSDQLALVPEARLIWQHEYLCDNDTLHANLAGGTSPNFAYQTAGSDGDSIFTGLGIGFQTPSGVSGNLSYDIEIGRESAINQTLSLGADWKF